MPVSLNEKIHHPQEVGLLPNIMHSLKTTILTLSSPCFTSFCPAFMPPYTLSTSSLIHQTFVWVFRTLHMRPFVNQSGKRHCEATYRIRTQYSTRYGRYRRTFRPYSLETRSKNRSGNGRGEPSTTPCNEETEEEGFNTRG